MTKTEARRKHGLDKKVKMPKDPKIPSSNMQDSMGGRYQHGKDQYKVGPARQGVNQSKGRSVNKNLKTLRNDMPKPTNPKLYARVKAEAKRSSRYGPAHMVLLG